MPKPNWSNEGLQRIIDAGKKGGETTRKKIEKETKKKQEEYLLNPKLCYGCETVIPYEKRNTNKFCCRSCSIKTSNKKRTISTLKNCLHCNSILSKSAIKFCSHTCQRKFEYSQRIDMWMEGKLNPKARSFFKKYLTETYGYKCSCCGIDEWNGKELILEIDHIDGIPDNNEPKNLRFICPNCHSQTDTYKGKNIGNGRHYRKVRYSNGQSY
jgi:hypothetical protein